MHVINGATATVMLDFLADKSLYTASSGAMIFVPALIMETRSNAKVQTDAGGIVTIAGGTVTANVNMGMDLSGYMQQNFILDTKKGLQITNGIVVPKI